MNPIVHYHPYPAFIPEGAETLILGSVPPGRFCLTEAGGKSNPAAWKRGDVDFFYGSVDNAFWELIGNACGVAFDRTHPQQMAQQIRSFLAYKKMGITDVFTEVWRKHHWSALDTDIDVNQSRLTDLPALLRRHPGIRRLLYTSSFVQSVVYKMKLRMGNGNESYHKKTDPKGRHGIIDIGGQIYDYEVLYSPSPTALRGLPEDGEAIRQRQYDRVFGG